jgi:hypothetical protein
MTSYVQFDVWQNTAGVNYNAVIQTQSYTYTGQFTTTTHGGPGSGPSTAGTDTPLTVSITPKFSTSKILVRATGSAGYNSGQQVWLGSIKRVGASTVYSPSSPGGSMANWSQSVYISGSLMTIFNIEWYDTPGSTTACTYTLRITGNNNTSYGVGIGIADVSAYTTWGGINTITAMEIAQ